MADVEISCPKCGELCSKNTGGWITWILLGIVTSIFTFGVGLIVFIILYYIRSKSIPFECTNCGFKWLH